MGCESELDMVQRHVRAGERIVARQFEIIAELKQLQAPTLRAETLLATFQSVQAMHQAHLARLLTV